MRQRSYRDSKPSKTRAGKTAAPKRSHRSKSARHQSPGVTSEKEITRLTRDRDEAREQQKATAEILRVIRNSPADAQPVFEMIVRSAVSLCGSLYANVFRFDGELLHFVAFHNVGPIAMPGASVPSRKNWRHHVDFLKTKYPMRPDSSQVAGRAVLTKSVVRLEDVLTDPDYDQRWPISFRRLLGVPMLRDGEPLGVIVAGWAEAGPVPKVQEELLKTFADQAVIAIENARLLNELRESLDQQTATSEVLRVISSSPGELEPVFKAMLENAVTICEAKFGTLYLRDADAFRVVAAHNTPPAYTEARQREPTVRPPADSVLGRVSASKQTVHITDVKEVQSYTERNPYMVAAVELGGARTALGVPLLKEDVLVGAITIFRQDVRPFTDKQTELLTNFAAQAVIAIENTRLLNELRQRTTDLTESLEQQTATAKVLSVISSSPGDLQPVFASMLENAVRICDAKFGNIYRWEDDALHLVASHNTPPAFAQARRRSPFRRADAGELVINRMLTTKTAIHVADVAAQPGYIDRSDHGAVAAVELGGVRTVLAVPMLRENELIGSFTVYRQEVRPFTDKQIALVQNFADQAVIAIENTRLLNELRQRTSDLTESLEQQTAISEILRVISNSPSDVLPVLASVAENAARICEAQNTNIIIVENDFLRVAMRFGEIGRPVGEQFPLDRSTIGGRSVIDMQPIQIADLQQAGDEFALGREFATEFGYHTVLGVPLIREGRALGCITILRAEARPFEQKHIALLSTFADQAAIAIENVRLFEAEQQHTRELTESLEQQTATADVLKVISRSTFDLQTVLQTLVESAARLCDADKATITRKRGDAFYRAEAYGFSAEYMDYVRDMPVLPEQGYVIGRALLEGKGVHVPDVQADPEYTEVEQQRLGGYRTVLGIPMLREGIPIGVLGLTRDDVRPFTNKQIELVQTFADQAAIAIENVRLFNEIQDKSRQLEEASQHKSQFLANMSHELRTPLNAILGYTELMADGAYGEPSEKMLGILKRLEANGRHLLGLINDVLDLSKIEAGQLVLELSDYCVQDIAQTVRSTLEPLASDKKLAFKLELAPNLPPGHGDGRRLTQVLINLVGNAIKFTDAGEVAIKAEANNGSFHVSVRDTGPGISADDQAKLFQEFQQADNAITRKKGGTGLGLAISKRIIEMHGGRIWVESQVGQGSTFTFTLPVVVERQVEAA